MMKKMKKFIFALGLVAMMLNLTNCAQYDDVNSTLEPKGNFEIYASATRTANAGDYTIWSAGDDLAVFHAVTDDTTYTSDGQFKLEDVTTGRFLGNVSGELDPQEEYDWYAIYPYLSYITGPANVSTGMIIGCAAGAKQTQTGNNSMAHIAGTNYPLVGKHYAAPAGTSPKLAMTHVASLVEFEVTNSSDEAITVSSIQFTAPEAIVGTFYINFTDIANIKATSSGDNYTSKSATLVVNEGTAIEKGASAKFYLPVAPFVAKAGANLALVVNATSATGSVVHEKTIALTSDVAFKSGKIKTVKVDYKTAVEEPVGPVEVTDVLNRALTGVTKNTTSYTEWSNKTSNSSAVYKGQSAGGNDAIQLRTTNSNSGIVTTTSGGKVRKVVVTWQSSTSSGRTLDIYGKNTAYTAATDLYNSSSSTKGTKLGSIKYGTSTELVITGNYQYIGLRSNDGAMYITEIKITWETEGNGGETPATPILGVNHTTLSFDAAGGAKTVTCTVDNEVSGQNVTATESVDWLTTSVSGKTVTINATANTGAARTANVTIAYTGAESKTVTVNQAAAEQGGGDEGGSTEPAKFVKVTSAPSDWSGTYLIVYEGGKLAFNGSLSSLDAVSNTKTVTISNSQIEATDAMKAIAFTIAKSGSNYTIKSASGKYIGNNSNSNALTANTSAMNNTIAFVSANDITIKSSGGAYLRYNATSGQTRFRYYKSSTYTSQKAIQLYKLQ